MFARCGFPSKLRFLPPVNISTNNCRGLSASHAPAKGDDAHGGGEVEHVKVTPRYYIVLGDQAWTDKKMPIEEVKPTPRTTVEWNGKKYPYPYRGIIEEENGAAVLRELETSGAVTKDGYLRWWKIPKEKRHKYLQIWFQRETDRPIWMQLAYDDIFYRLFQIMVILGVLSSFYLTYVQITPEKENIFIAKNWERWNAEKKH